MKEFDKKDNQEREEIYSKAIRAGKRTYFFDVKSTRKNDLYLTITERKRRYENDGRFQIEKHKIFLYKEDFEKFTEGLSDVVEYIKSRNENLSDADSELREEDFTQVEFEDLEQQ